MINTKFGRWFVLSKAHSDSNNRAYYDCVCDCGVARVIRGDGLTMGKTKSCGCLQREVVAAQGHRHGRAARGSNDYLYTVWENMKARCDRVTHPEYKRYGARGIKYCPQWAQFAQFEKDVVGALGERPHKSLSFDRYPDNAGNYEIGNIRWASKQQQSQNSRNTIGTIVCDGRTFTISELGRYFGVKRQTLAKRIRDWGLEKAIHFSRSNPSQGTTTPPA